MKKKKNTEREIENFGPNIFSPANLKFWILRGVGRGREGETV